MKIKHNKLLFMVLSSIILLIACTKTETKSPLQFQKDLLAGTGTYLNTQHTWQLDSFYNDGTNFPLTTIQKEYKKTFTYEGVYSDTELNTGKWEIATLGKLKQTIIYKSTNKQDSSVYDIVSISAARLNLSIKLSNGKLGNYLFKIAN
jgi:hypothetical protein